MIRVFMALILAALALSGCFGSRRHMIGQGADLSRFKTVAIYPPEAASFIDLELERMLIAAGYTVIGIREVPDHLNKNAEVLGVRYRQSEGTDYSWALTISLVDERPGRTVLTIEGQGPDKDRAWRQAQRELQTVLDQSR